MTEIPSLDKIPGIIKVFYPLKEREKTIIFMIKMQIVDSVRGSFPTYEMKGSHSEHTGQSFSQSTQVSLRSKERDRTQYMRGHLNCTTLPKTEGPLILCFNS